MMYYSRCNVIYNIYTLLDLVLNVFKYTLFADDMTI